MKKSFSDEKHGDLLDIYFLCACASKELTNFNELNTPVTSFSVALKQV